MGRFNGWKIDQGPLKGKMIYLLTKDELAALPNGTVLVSISGRKVKKSKTTDSDMRFGYTAYGLFSEME